jgi:DNA-binding NtrC family response regulator
MSTLAAPYFRVETPQADYLTTEDAATSASPAVLVATVDPEIRSGLAALLEASHVKIVWAKSVKEVRSALARESFSACFCGFWLADGTYREVMRHLKSRPVEIPAIIACPPKCPNESRDYLAALHIRGFDFICYPYTAEDLQRVLGSIKSPQPASEHPYTSRRRSGNEFSYKSSLRKAG